jgi:CBS domain-containing protein
MTAALRVSDVMQGEVVTLQRCDRLDLADDVMRLGRVRHMPVLASGRVVGVVSNRDLLAAGLSRALEFDPDHRRAFLHSVEVAEVMSDEVVTVAPDAALSFAAECMLQRQIGCLPVVGRDGGFLGLVTETDLIRAAWLPAPEPTEGKSVMSEIGDRIEQEVDSLRRVRDELRVQTRLARADAKDLFEELEGRWRELEGRLEQLAREAREPVQEVGEAVRLLLKEIQEGYRKVRGSL